MGEKRRKRWVVPVVVAFLGFVRLKMSRALNLGTFTSALAHDWQSLDLKVADGALLLLWTE